MDAVVVLVVVEEPICGASDGDACGCVVCTVDVTAKVGDVGGFVTVS
jgi:hypothetical protein